MKILLLGNYPPDRQESMLRFADLLEQQLAARGHQVRRIFPQPLLGHGQVGVQKWLGYGDKYLVFPLQLRRALGWCDLVHICDHANAVYTRYLQAIPHVVTCNDLLAIRSAQGEFTENPTGWTGRILQRLILEGLNRAQWVACISHHTRQDLMRLGSLPPDRVAVIHMGQNYGYAPVRDPTPSLRQLQIPAQSRFLIHVGGNQWYKNRLGVLSIFRILKTLAPDPWADLKLVMVGKPFTEEMRAFVTQHQLQDQVLERVSVSNPDLQALYSAAVALIFPSLMEGFGWPVIEAQACGCAVVCGQEGPLPEVAGEGALLAPARQEQTLAQHLLKLITDPELRADLVQRGYTNVTRFRTELMIEAYEQLYQTAASPFTSASHH